MAKNSKRIEIVASAMAGLSSMGPKSRLAIQAVLMQEYDHVDITIVNNVSDLVALAARKPDIVFLGMKFIPKNPDLGLSDPDKIWLSEYLEERGIVCTGSSYEAVSLEFDKQLAKGCVLNAGLLTPRHLVIKIEDAFQQEEIGLRYPLFIKPTNLGGGKGVDTDSLVHTFQELTQKVAKLRHDFKTDALVEEYLPGPEFSVGILKDPLKNEYSALPIELIAPLNVKGARFLSHQIKQADTERYTGVSDIIFKHRLNAFALDVFLALGARDYGRIDIRLDSLGRPHFLEANLLPSLAEGYGNFPKTCLLNAGMRYDAVILNIVNLAILRQAPVYNMTDELPVLSSPQIILASA